MSTDPSQFSHDTLEQTSTRTRQSPKTLLLVVGLVAMLAVGLGTAAAMGVFSGSKPIGPMMARTFTLSGSITLIPSSSAYSLNEITYGAGSCQGSGPYSDMSPGVAVLVADSQGHTVATGSLEAGIEQSGDGSGCRLPFDVPDVPAGLQSYSVTVSHRGTQVVSSIEAHTGVNLTLGGN
jgi:hypothetical protein